MAHPQQAEPAARRIAVDAAYYAAVLHAITSARPDLPVSERAVLADRIVGSLAGRGLLAPVDTNRRA